MTELVTQKEAALEYAAAGFRVLPLYGVLGDRCMCGKYPCGNANKGAGKHPREYLPHGIHSATSDPAIIETWAEPFNVGIAGSDNFPIIDIDDLGVAQALLYEGFALKDKEIVALTRRGLHIYLHCAYTPSGIISHPDGRRIGEVRADGLYVVAPPSVHTAGEYRWLGQSALALHGMSQLSVDAYEMARVLLLEVGVPTAPHTATKEVVSAMGEIKPLEPHFPIQLGTMLRQLLDGVRPVNDRSDALFLIACECYRTAPEGTDLDPVIVAGIVRQADAAHYQKYSTRRDAARRYAEASLKAREAVIAQRAQEKAAQGEHSASQQRLSASATDTMTDPGGDEEGWYDDRENDSDIFVSDPIVAGPIADPTGGGNEQASLETLYSYDPVRNLFLYHGGKQPEIICNFHPRIVERLDVYSGFQTVDGESEDAEWVLEATRYLGDGRGEQYRIPLKSTEYSDARRFTEAIRKKVPSHFVIEDRVQGKLLSGVQHTSGLVSERTAYAASGWLPDVEEFIVPGIKDGAITATGFNPEIVFTAAGKTPPFMAETRTYKGDPRLLPDALRLVMTVAPAAAILPIMGQYLSAPFCSIGFDNRALMHVMGSTGTFKTSVAEALLAIYGYTKSAQSMGVTSWTASTAGVVRQMPFWFRDLPCLLDDYKSGAQTESIVSSLVQGYGDTRARMRLSRDGSFGNASEPRGLALSTGEDIWEHQKANLARTFIVNFYQGTVDFEVLKALHLAAEDGTLATIGINWLHWLCSKGKAWLSQYLKDQVAEQHAHVMAVVGADTMRVTTQVTALRVTTRLFCDFLQDTCPEAVVSEFKHYAGLGWAELLKGAREQVETGDELSPYNQIVSSIREALEAGTICLKPQRDSNGKFIGSGPLCVGFTDEKWVHLGQWVTFGWYETERRRAGHDVGFSWKQFVSECKKRFDTEPKVMRLGDGVQRSYIRVPLHVIDETLEVLPFTPGGMIGDDRQ